MTRCESFSAKGRPYAKICSINWSAYNVTDDIHMSRDKIGCEMPSPIDEVVGNFASEMIGYVMWNMQAIANGVAQPIVMPK